MPRMMSDLTIQPHCRVLVVPDTIIISNTYALILVCPKCGQTKNILLYDLAHGEVPPPHVRTGIAEYPSFQTCRCNAPHSGGETYKLLQDVLHAVKHCKDKEDVMRMLESLIVQAEKTRVYER